MVVFVILGNSKMKQPIKTNNIGLKTDFRQINKNKLVVIKIKFNPKTNKNSRVLVTIINITYK
jgi:hypothetical protein